MLAEKLKLTNFKVQTEYDNQHDIGFLEIKCEKEKGDKNIDSKNNF